MVFNISFFPLHIAGILILFLCGIYIVNVNAFVLFFQNWGAENDSEKIPPDIKTVRLIQDRIIADFHATELMIRGTMAMADK